MRIEAELPDEDLQEAIVESAAASIVSQIGDELRHNVRDAVTEQIHAQVGAIVTEEIEKPVQRTDCWGGRKGEPVPLRDLIIAEAQKHLSEKVNERGEASGYSERNRTRLEYQLQVVATKAVQDAMKAEIAGAVQAIRAEMEGKMTDMIREAIKGLIAIK